MKNTFLASSAPKALRLLMAASIGALASSLEADAASLLFTDTDSFSNALTELENMPALVVDKFNRTGFNVTEVRVTLNASLESEGTVTNTARQRQTFTVITQVSRFDVCLELCDPDEVEDPLIEPLMPFPTRPEIGNVRYVRLAPNTPASFGPFTIEGSDINSYTDSDIARFLGTGTITFSPFTTIATTISGGGGNVANAIETLANASLTIEYFGDELPPPLPNRIVPEPSALIGLGLMAGLSAMAKRKKA